MKELEKFILLGLKKKSKSKSDIMTNLHFLLILTRTRYQSYRIRPFPNPCNTNINTVKGLFFHFWVDNYFQDGTSCKWVSRNESRPVRNIWLTDWFFFEVWAFEDDILQLHKRKPCLKVVIRGVKMTATLWQCPYVNSEITCSAHEIKTCRPISQNAAHYIDCHT